MMTSYEQDAEMRFEKEIERLREKLGESATVTLNTTLMGHVFIKENLATCFPGLDLQRGETALVRMHITREAANAAKGGE